MVQGDTYDYVISRCYEYFSNESHDEMNRLRALRCIGHSLSMKNDDGGAAVLEVT